MSIRSLILHNFWIKLFSVLLATLIWFAVQSGIEKKVQPPKNPITSPNTKNIYVPVRILTQPGEAVDFKVEPAEIVISVTGEDANLRDLDPKKNVAYVNLTGFRSSRETNQQVQLDVPNGITVNSMLPRAVKIERVNP
jgi:hypothetical protein